MSRFVLPFAVLVGLAVPAGEPALDLPAARGFAALVLKGAVQEYPNKLDHVMNGPGEVKGPRALHPAFYGCFDWHSAVHGHWLLARTLRSFPGLPEAERVRALLDAHLAEGPIAGELAYLEGPGRRGFERTYGWAWLLKLSAELRRWEHPDARRWEAALRPLAEALACRLDEHLRKQDYPIRTGVHPNSAFTLDLALDYADAAGDTALRARLEAKARAFFGRDRKAPLAWEPGSEDFLSPCLEEAALMARVLPGETFHRWMAGFLPGLLKGEGLAPARVSDRTDPRIVHLDGLNLSRARCLYRLARALPQGDPAAARLARLADLHLRASLPHVASGSYEGEHWLPTFALLALEARKGR